MAAIFVTWYPSNFPATSSATGIDGAEWRWLALMSLSLAAVMLANALIYHREWLPRLPEVGRVAGALFALIVAGVILVAAVPESLPVDRADWFWLLALLIPVMLARYYLYRRIWTFTLYEAWFLLFIFLCILSVEFAPYPSRGLRMLIRPLLGMALTIAVIDAVRRVGHLRAPLIGMVALALLIGALALGGTQWTAKSIDFEPILDALPDFDVFFARGGFNPNEIAGAMTWLIPLMGVLVLWRWPGPYGYVWRGLALVAFIGLMMAVLLGQSRFAIAGVLGALVCIALLVIPSPWRYIAFGGVVLAIIIQAVILFNLLPGDEGSNTGTAGLTVRDSNTASQRLDIWDAAFDLIETHPLTGVGMNRWRYGPVARAFPVIGYDIPDPADPDSFRQRRLPHTHNELIQITTDLGLPGGAFFIGVYLATAYMLWVSWRNGDKNERLLVMGIAGGLLAHAAYGIGDAVPVWDRFSFIFWLMLGLAGGQYVLIKDRHDETGESEALSPETYPATTLK